MVELTKEIIKGIEALNSNLIHIGMAIERQTGVLASMTRELTGHPATAPGAPGAEKMNYKFIDPKDDKDPWIDQTGKKPNPFEKVGLSKSGSNDKAVGATGDEAEGVG